MSTRPLALPVADFIQVSVAASTGAVAARQFNQGLLVGSSPRIPSYGTNPRLRQYASQTAMVADGFLVTDPEYIAAGLYFAQVPAPQFVWIGRQDLTSIAAFNISAAGTNYLVGDIITVIQGGASNGQLKVTSIGGGGAVTGLALITGSQGTGYSIASGLATSGGSGSGLTVNITAIGDSFLQAVQACALTNQNWYGFTCLGAVFADHQALASYSNSNFLTALYFGTTSDVAVLNGAAGNIALTLQAAKYKAFMIYSSTQGGAAPNNAYAAAGVLGLFCGLNTGLAASAFTLNLKAVSGVTPEALTQTQYISITGANCNVSASFGPYVGYLSTGILESGDFADQVLYRATLVNLIQINLMNLLVSSPKVPQTDAGEQQLLAQVDAACAQLLVIGYIGPGVYQGNPILDLKGNVLIATGQPLPRGYLSVAPPYNQQTLGNRTARQAMPISTVIKEAGAVHSVAVQVSVQL